MIRVEDSASLRGAGLSELEAYGPEAAVKTKDPFRVNIKPPVLRVVVSRLLCSLLVAVGVYFAVSLFK